MNTLSDHQGCLEDYSLTNRQPMGSYVHFGTLQTPHEQCVMDRQTDRQNSRMSE